MSEGESHSWWRFVPPSEQAERKAILWRLRLRNRLNSRAFWLLLLLGFYAAVYLALVRLLSPPIVVLALAPMVLLPMLGYLAYWLTWKEFHE
ncbi:hypothetical protein [Synechococcus sp. CBW1006]|uniref:hypothetical protein n=1 Tax=Synechococcus sp. CBW1006 TaxID=1353138 RepID=UPI0018CCD62F|nr:hypothetical protein [Synechococcus sp. CBW1006]QPN65819.1 hypothetical protein H8F26_13075 [Synechococcus sp. CBW1006]